MPSIDKVENNLICLKSNVKLSLYIVFNETFLIHVCLELRKCKLLVIENYTSIQFASQMHREVSFM